MEVFTDEVCFVSQGVRMGAPRLARPPLAAWLVILALVLVHGAHAHVALTYPPARRLDLDFLDNARTPGPCGMPKG